MGKPKRASPSTMRAVTKVSKCKPERFVKLLSGCVTSDTVILLFRKIRIAKSKPVMQLRNT